MKIKIYPNKQTMGKAAAQKAAEILKGVLDKKGKANFVIATGASQFDFLENLVQIDSIDWSKTTMFHLDEYVGIPDEHPASFRKYLKDRFISKVHPGDVYLIKGDAKDPEQECDRLNRIIGDYVIDISFVGIGENGHLAFNDPPADFDIEDPYLVVQLDEACRKQQLGEGWFKNLDDVPKRAISMSIKQIMKSKNIVCTVPDKRKAQAVRNCFKGDAVSPDCPASILKKHDNCFVFLDDESSIYLKE
jgi:glucosamine-6-phosphate deaminase